MAGFSQYSPSQVLEAGRRAEADGKYEYALQFYSHVVTHHPGTMEATEAADALRRLDGPEPEQRGNAPQSLPPPAHPGQPYGGIQRQNSGVLAPASTYGVPATAPSVRAPPGNNGRRGADERGLVAASQSNTRRRAKAPHDTGQAPSKTYRLGRTMAALLSFFGWAGIVVGLVELGSSVVLGIGKMPNAALSALSASPPFAIGVIASACVAILLSQMAQATFDAASRPPTRDDGPYDRS